MKKLPSVAPRRGIESNLYNCFKINKFLSPGKVRLAPLSEGGRKKRKKKSQKFWDEIQYRKKVLQCKSEKNHRGLRNGVKYWMEDE